MSANPLATEKTLRDWSAGQVLASMDQGGEGLRERRRVDGTDSVPMR